MTYNLLEERWLPVARADGTRDMIAPWEITAGQSPPVELAPPRPDFKAALMELLIGLVQTACPPGNKRDWRVGLEQPPAPEALRTAFEPHARYFNLFGDRPLFMQDFTLTPPKKRTDLNGVAALLIDSPGGQTERNNGDFFVKRGLVEALCPACAAMAMFTLQAFAPAGGAGIRTSLRGGGPLSTLVDFADPDHPSTLWQKVWLNVFSGETPPDPPELAGPVYPWAAPTRTSEKNEETHPTDVNGLQAFWGMPRRMLLLPENDGAAPACDLCGVHADTMVRSYAARPRGTNYGPTWQHPLTPYRDQGDKPHLSIKGSSGATGYGHWLGVVYGQDTAKGVRRAKCVGHACRTFRKDKDRLAVTVAGYDMDNMKARQWCESVFPVFFVDDECMEHFRRTVEMLVEATDRTRLNLSTALKEALVHESGHRQAKADKTLFAGAQAELWHRTEARFYALAEDVARVGDFEATQPMREAWRDDLKAAARGLFDAHARSGRVQPERIRRVVKAGRKLDNFNYAAATKILELPAKRGEK